MSNSRNFALRREHEDEIEARERETADQGAREAEATGERQLSRTVELEDSQSLTLFDALQLRLRNRGDDGQRLGVELDFKLKGPRPDQLGELEEDEEESDDTELGIEDESSEEDESIDESEEEDEDEGARDSELSAEDEDDLADESAEDEDDEDSAPEDSLIEEEDEESATYEDDDEDEDLEARAEEDDEDEEDLEARAEDDDDEDIEESDEDSDLEARADEDSEQPHDDDDEAEKRVALRSAGDGGSVTSAAVRSNDNQVGPAGSALRLARERKPRPLPAKRSQADRVIRIAKKQVGYREGKNDHTKFSAELIKRKIAQSWWQNQPWCQTFQAWAFVEAGYRKLAPMTPGCETAIAWFRARKRVNRYPAIGAQVFYGRGGGDHVGLVYKYGPKYIWTVEGNTNQDGSSRGIGVFLKKRARKSAFGYGYPKYVEGIVTADPRKKGKAGFTFKKNASSGARDDASEPEREEKVLPWVSIRQVRWAATHKAAAERAAKAGAANPRGDVKLVQQALEKVMGTRSKDPAGIFEADTQRLFHRFRTHKLKFRGIRASAAPGAKGLTALGKQSKLFRVRTGAMVVVDDNAGSTAPAKLSPRDVTFKRCTTPSSPENLSKWIRQACRKAGVTPSSAWVKGYKTIIKRESGGNPNACNVWDSNAKTPPGYRKVKDFGDGYTRNGIVRLNGRLTHFQCSRGIVQCIPQTFAQHHARGTSRNIYDPVASVAASIRYVLSRYDVAKDGSNLARQVQQADPTRPPKGY